MLAMPNLRQGTKMKNIPSSIRDNHNRGCVGDFLKQHIDEGSSPNIELNMEVTDDRDRTDLLNWFKEIWNDDTGLS